MKIFKYLALTAIIFIGNTLKAYDLTFKNNTDYDVSVNISYKGSLLCKPDTLKIKKDQLVKKSTGACLWENITATIVALGQSAQYSAKSSLGGTNGSFSIDINAKKITINSPSQPKSIAPAAAQPQTNKAVTADFFSYLYDPSIQDEIKKPGQYKNLIKLLMQKFGTIAKNKGQAFTSGTFVIEDPKGNLFTFLKSYPDTYQRSSSHFPERIAKAPGLAVAGAVKGYGIDMDLTGIPGLLGEKRTILFNEFTLDGKKLIFIKPEAFGTSGTIDKVLHGLDYVWTKAARALGKKETDDMRREHPPVAIVEKWKAMVDASSLDKANKDLFKEQGKKEGILKMLAILKNNPKAFTNDGLNTSFFDALMEFDNIEIRKGNEVIITQKELFPPSVGTVPDKAKKILGLENIR